MSQAQTLDKQRFLLSAILAGMVAGTTDLTAATVSNGLDGIGPMRLYQAIASGLLGKASFDGGLGTAALGVSLHFAMMLAYAGAFVLLYRKVEAVRLHPLMLGALYGLTVCAWMYMVVLPQSSVPFHPPLHEAKFVLREAAMHIVFVGLPIAAVTRATQLRPI